MTPEQLSSLFGVLLSLAFSYMPGLKGWYMRLDADYKRVVMLFGLVLVALGAYALACAGQYSGFTCGGAGFAEVVRVFVAALVANQATYLMSPKLK